MSEKKKPQNIGTIGHIDHGKTTLTSAIVEAIQKPIVITGQGTIAKEMEEPIVLKAPGIDFVQKYDGPKPVGNLEQSKNKWTMMRNEQTPAVPEMSIEELLGHKEILHDFLIHASNSYSNGLGVAANQVGIIKEDQGVDHKLKHDVIRFMLPAFAKKNRESGEWFLVLNPKIIRTSGLKREKKEYCLTWPNKVVVVDRVHSVEVEYYDIAGKKHTIVADDFEAQIWQHEINHLLGIEETVVNSAGGLEVSTQPKRNDPCPCGSKKKYKKCCLTKT